MGNNLKSDYAKVGIVNVFALLFATVMALASCEKLDFDRLNDGKVKVTVRVKQFEQIAFDEVTRALSSPTDVCTHIDMVVYDAEGNKATTVSQKVGDSGFGTAVMQLSPGQYTLVVVAQNGTGKATMTSMEEVSFTNNKTTDTFYYCKQIAVGEKGEEFDLTLERCVAMVRFLFTDKALPENITRMKFYYTGGSSTLNAKTGFGAKQSKQTEYRDIASAMRDKEGNLVFEIYTIPHEKDDVLKITITALDANDNESFEAEFDGVPVTVNKISQFKGAFFTSEPEEFSSNAVTMKINTTWGGTETFEF